MNGDKKKHIVNVKEPIRRALQMMNELDVGLTLFVVDDAEKLIGTITDGDARRGLLKGLTIDDSVDKYMQKTFMFILKDQIDLNVIRMAKGNGIEILPMIDNNGRIHHLINFSYYHSYLPIDVVIMAGGEGIRLRPLTETVPKPLLRIGSKPIVEHVIDRLMRFGAINFQISVNYLANKIEEYFGDGGTKNVSISYIHEKDRLGTIGSLSLVDHIENESVLVINSDILTNIDYENFFLKFKNSDADLMVACIPYNISIPYAVVDIENNNIIGMREKPTLNLVTNAGIYLLKNKHISRIPKRQFYDATDLIEEMITAGLNVRYYNLLEYWLDIGKMDDYKKAQNDIMHIKI
jgi:dTDP-glucose pyrophosphorylase